ncbi:MAG: ketoacyl-ACP synthase III [Planctomycetes bacterium]|nr:ketoacyl-ACP synthase III [Planctomycetota bacterium]
MYQCYVSGTGSFVPEKRLTNFDLEKLVDTSDEWIRQRTGISERRVVVEGEATSDLAVKAAERALAAAEMDPKQIEAVVLCTVTPDTYMPAGAVYVQKRLGLSGCAAFDLSAACTGFVYGTAVATAFVQSGMYQHVLVIGAETLSRVVDYADRGTCILFGDGAGAAVYSRAEAGSPSGVLDSQLCADGNGAELIEIRGGGSASPASHETVESKEHLISMNGKEVFKFATKTMVELIETALERNSFKPQDLALIVPHQVNSRIIEAALKKLDLPADRLFLNLERYGNTSAASVPIALDEAVRAGRMNRGDLVLFVAFGAGLTWGYNLLRW